MSWSLNASGHNDSAEKESEAIDTLREAVKKASATYASVSTQYHGVVNLLEQPEESL